MVRSAEKRGYQLDIVGNPDPDSAAISIRHLAPDGTESTRETGLAWPASLVSLGHVALPFPPDDPVYGFLPGSGHNGIPSIGSWLLRGENGAVTITLGALTRLRSNPFCVHKITDPQLHEIARSQLAINGQVKQRQFANPTAELQPNPDRPDVLWLERRLLADELAFVPCFALLDEFHDRPLGC